MNYIPQELHMLSYEICIENFENHELSLDTVKEVFETAAKKSFDIPKEDIAFDTYLEDGDLTLYATIGNDDYVIDTFEAAIYPYFPATETAPEEGGYSEAFKPIEWFSETLTSLLPDEGKVSLEDYSLDSKEDFEERQEDYYRM